MCIMYCNFNMFDLNAQVVSVNENNTNAALFYGNFEEVSEFMAAEYQTHNYEKIVLGGAYARTLEDRIRAYSKVNYNFDDINIEVI